MCEDKYTGVDCGTPICSNICVADQGMCTSPDYCHCEEGYWGPDCSGVCDCGDYGECNSGEYILDSTVSSRCNRGTCIFLQKSVVT